jgi:hypothetical protein
MPLARSPFCRRKLSSLTTARSTSVWMLYHPPSRLRSVVCSLFLHRRCDRLRLHPRPRTGPPDDRHPEHRRFPVNDKLQSLRSYRRMCELCMCCEEKWHQGHNCAANIQLHALQEVWELCQDALSKDQTDQTEPTTPPTDQLFMLLSAAVVSSSVHPRTLQFQGIIQGQPISILVDSGSTHSFLDSRLASLVTGVQQLHSPASVKVANGSSITLFPNSVC